MDQRDLEGFWGAPEEPGVVWQVALFLLPMWLEPEEGSEPRLKMVWAALCLDLGTGEIAMSRIADAPEASLAVDALPDLARRTGYRPARIQVSDLEVAEQIRSAIADRPGRPEVELRDGLLELGAVFKAFREHIAGSDLPGYLSVPGVTVERVAAYARAAAAFFAATPWLLLGPTDLIEIEAPDLDPEAGSSSFRLHVFGRTTEKGILAFLSGDDFLGEEEDHATPDLPWSLIFLPAERIPLEDLELWTRHGLPRPEPEAYPFLFYPVLDEIDRPEAWQLALFEGVLRLFTAVTQEEVDRGEVEREVETFDGPFRLRLRVAGLPVENDEIEDLAGKDPHPWQRAENLIDAGQSGTRRSVLLARRALEIWPDCAAAYVALGEAAQDIEAALDFYRQGIEAGRRALGPEALGQPGQLEENDEAVGFLTAFYALAGTLHEAGRYAEAVEPLRELLRLDPLDPGKARYLLADSFLRLQRHEDLQELFGRYRDASAFWTWPRALLAFRREGDSPAARELLQAAVRGNRHVPHALADPIPGFPGALSRLVRTGSEDEAYAYAADGRAAWDATPGALEWLAGQTSEETKRERPRRKK
jgi:tetratricopeptide (TPR) repeat protein